MLLSVTANASTIIQKSSQLRYSHAIGLNSQVAVEVHSSTNLRDLKSMYRILKHISETKDGFSKRYFNENIAAKNTLEVKCKFEFGNSTANTNWWRPTFDYN